LAVLDVDWAAYLQRFAPQAPPALLAGLQPAAGAAAAQPKTTSTPSASDLRAALAAAPALRRMDLLVDRIQAEAARIMGLDGGHAIDEMRPLRDLGLDSLMSVELRNVIAIELGAKLPATLLFEHPSVGALARFLADGPLDTLFARAEETPADDDLDGLGAVELATVLERELRQVRP
jgi:acyl carrier protein